MASGFVPVLEEDLLMEIRGREEVVEDDSDDVNGDDMLVEELSDDEYEDAHMPDSKIMNTRDKWNRIQEKYSNQKRLFQKRQKSMEEKEKLMETGKVLNAKIDRIEGKMKIEKCILNTYTDSYRSSLTASKREQDKF